MAVESAVTATDADVAAFKRDGVVCLRGVFDPYYVDLFARGLERNMAEPGARGGSLTEPDGPGAFFKDANVWPRIPEYVEYVFDSPAGAVAARLMRSKTVRFFIETAFDKEPGTPNRTPWHQDQPYYPLDGTMACSLWMPVDPVAKENGMAFVAGSHRWGRWFTPKDFDGPQTERPFSNAGFESVPDIDAHPEDYKILAWDLEPGDCLAFHMLTLHGSAGNLAKDRRRRAFSTRWIGDDATYAIRDGMLSAPYPAEGLKHGDRFHTEQFPQVWPRPK